MMRPVILGVTLAAVVLAGLASVARLARPLALVATPLVAAQAGGPPVTVALLRQALLVEADLPDDWSEDDTGELEQRFPAVYADFSNLDDDFLSVELHDARNGAPDFLALSFLAGMTVERLTQVAPTEYGTNGVRYRYQYEEGGEQWYGEVAAWQQGAVVVALLIESLDSAACVCEYATLQYYKLTAFGHA